MIPVVFIHRGNQEYLDIALRQAKQWNPEVILLGDASNSQLGFEHCRYDSLFGRASRFTSLYQHMSTNPRNFELFCIQRWFVLAGLMRLHDYDEIFYCDSDVMLYCDVSGPGQVLSNRLATYAMAQRQSNYRWSAAGHVSYWTKLGLAQFCDFIDHVYGHQLGKLEEKWNWHRRTKTPGGICDMTLLWLFSRENEIPILTRVHDNATFDENINISENHLPNEYRMYEGHKEITWHDRQPYGYNLMLRRPIRFNALHFQGTAKKLMKSHEHTATP